MLFQITNSQNKTAALLSHIVLKPHQQEAVDKTVANKGVVLFDHGVGTGKTLTSIAAFEKLRENGTAHKALVVLPSALKNNYLHEGINKFTNSQGVIIGAGNEKGRPGIVQRGQIPEGKDYYIVGNELFKQNADQIMDAIKPDTLIMDELHKYKDPNTSNYATMMRVRPQFHNAIGMTGTVVSNHPRDIVPELDLITNKEHSLGQYKNFDKKYVGEETKRTGFLGLIGPKETHEVLLNQKELGEGLRKYIHSYHARPEGMPEKKVNTIDVPMSPVQQNLYSYYMDEVNPWIKYKVEHNMPVGNQRLGSMLGTLIRTRQVSNSVGRFDSKIGMDRNVANTPKLHRLLTDVHTHLGESPDNKVVIYSNFYNGGVHEISHGLQQLNIPHSIFAGSKFTSKKDREQAVTDYMGGKVKAIVINSAGAEGLNLPGTTAHYALDGHYNPAMIEQSEARGIRSGSPVKEVPVNRYRSTIQKGLISSILHPFHKPTSVDQWIYSLAEGKQKLNDQLVGLINKDNKH